MHLFTYMCISVYACVGQKVLCERAVEKANANASVDVDIDDDI